MGSLASKFYRNWVRTLSEMYAMAFNLRQLLNLINLIRTWVSRLKRTAFDSFEQNLGFRLKRDLGPKTCTWVVGRLNWTGNLEWLAPSLVIRCGLRKILTGATSFCFSFLWIERFVLWIASLDYKGEQWRSKSFEDCLWDLCAPSQSCLSSPFCNPITTSFWWKILWRFDWVEQILFTLFPSYLAFETELEKTLLFVWLFELFIFWHLITNWLDRWKILHLWISDCEEFDRRRWNPDIELDKKLKWRCIWKFVCSHGNSLKH